MAPYRPHEGIGLQSAKTVLSGLDKGGGSKTTPVEAGAKWDRGPRASGSPGVAFMPRLPLLPWIGNAAVLLNARRVDPSPALALGAWVRRARVQYLFGRHGDVLSGRARR